MKNLLSENMLRFGTKNLSESQQKELVVKSIMETIDQHGLRNVIYRRLSEQKIPPHNPALEKQYAGSATTKYGVNGTIATQNPMKAKPGGKYMTQYAHAGYNKQNVGGGTDASNYIVIPKGTTFIADQATNCVYATVQRGSGWKQGEYTFKAYDAIDPTKQGELMAMGIPLICNDGVGDTDMIVKKYKSGMVLEDLSEHGIENFELDLSDFDKTITKQGAKDYFGLDKGIASYAKIYGELI